VTRLSVRKPIAHFEEIQAVAGRGDEGGPLRKVAVCAVIANPYAGKGFVSDLSEIIEASAEIGTSLGKRALSFLGAPAESYGKAGLVGPNGSPSVDALPRVNPPSPGPLVPKPHPMKARTSRSGRASGTTGICTQTVTSGSRCIRYHSVLQAIRLREKRR
jgi:Amino acid synthesis